MRGTRLWQSPGSPVIQGRSRFQRPLWQSWVISLAIAEAAVVVFGAVAAALGNSAGGPDYSSFPPVLLWALAALPGVVVGSSLGIALSRGLGWKPLWAASAAFGFGSHRKPCAFT